MMKPFFFGLILLVLVFSSINSTSAVCCFPWDITHHIDPETGFLVISGELWNDSYKGEPFGKTDYSFRFSDENQEVLFEKDILLTEEHPIKGGFVIPPGTVFPFQIVIEDIEPEIINQVIYVSTGGTNTLDYFEWKPADFVLNFDSLEEVKTIQGKTAKDNFTKWQISGTVTNTNSQRTENVYVLASLYGGEYQNIVGVAGYSDDDIQPLSLEGLETKEFTLYATIPSDKIPTDVTLYAESDDSSMTHQFYMPVILKDTTDHESRISKEYKKPINITANITNTSRENIDFDWIIQIIKSPKSASEGEVTKFPDSKVDFIKTIPAHVKSQEKTQLEYSWIPQSDGIYFYEMFVWENLQPQSFPFKGTFLYDNWLMVDSSSFALKNQLKSGTPLDKLECREHLGLANRASNGNFVCLKPESTSKLIERGWAEPAPVPEPEMEIIKETNYDSDKFYEEFGHGSPLIYLETSKPVLDYDNCDRYAYWLTEHQKEKINLNEDYPRYPPWGNQIFPLVDYCTVNGDLLKFETSGKIHWSFHRISDEIIPESEME